MLPPQSTESESTRDLGHQGVGIPLILGTGELEHQAHQLCDMVVAGNSGPFWYSETPRGLESGNGAAQNPTQQAESRTHSRGPCAISTLPSQERETQRNSEQHSTILLLPLPPHPSRSVYMMGPSLCSARFRGDESQWLHFEPGSLLLDPL